MVPSDIIAQLTVTIHKNEFNHDIYIVHTMFMEIKYKPNSWSISIVYECTAIRQLCYFDYPASNIIIMPHYIHTCLYNLCTI